MHSIAYSGQDYFLIRAELNQLRRILDGLEGSFPSVVLWRGLGSWIGWPGSSLSDLRIGGIGDLPIDGEATPQVLIEVCGNDPSRIRHLICRFQELCYVLSGCSVT